MIESLFGGSLASTVVCGSCGHNSTQHEKFMCVPHITYHPADPASSRSISARVTACFDCVRQVQVRSHTRVSSCCRDLSLPIASVPAAGPEAAGAAAAGSGTSPAASKPVHPLSAKQRKAAAKQVSEQKAAPLRQGLSSIKLGVCSWGRNAQQCPLLAKPQLPMMQHCLLLPGAQGNEAGAQSSSLQRRGS